MKNQSKINKKAIKNKMRFGMDLGWLLDRLLVDFGPKLEVKLGSSWHQNRSKWGTKTMSKNHIKFGHTVVRRGTRWYARVRGSWPLKNPFRIL